MPQPISRAKPRVGSEQKCYSHLLNELSRDFLSSLAPCRQGGDPWILSASFWMLLADFMPALCFALHSLGLPAPQVCCDNREEGP